MYSVKIYSQHEGEIEKFLELFYSSNSKKSKKNFELENKLFWKKDFDNPVEMIEIISTFIDNKEKFNANIWTSIDPDVFICVTQNNINNIIKYIYERFPY